MLSTKHLPNRLPGEKVLEVVRRDVFIIFRRIILFLLLLILPMLFFVFFFSDSPELLNATATKPLLYLGGSAYYLFTWLFFFFSFIDYYLDVWIITNRRIVDIEQKGFFSRVIAEHKLFRIQDVTSETHGAINTLLNFGDVHVQTAGTQQRFHFHQVPNPDRIRDLVIKLVQRNRKREVKEGNLSGLL